MSIKSTIARVLRPALLLVLLHGALLHAETAPGLFAVIREGLDKSPDVAGAREALGIAMMEEPGVLANTDPVFSAGFTRLDDEAPRAAPTFEGPFARSRSYDMALRQSWLIGTEARVYWSSLRLENPASFRTIDPSVETQLGIELRQPLLRYFWGRPDKARRRQARAGVRAAEGRLDRTREEAAARIAYAYVELWVARENERIRLEALEASRRLRRATLEKRRYGLTEASDEAQVEASVRAEEAELRLARSLAAQSVNTLNALLMRGDAPFTFDGPALPALPVASTPIYSEALSAAMAARPDLAAARADVERAEALVRTETLRTLPDLALVGGYAGAGLSGDRGRAWRGARQFEDTVSKVGVQFETPLGRRQEKLRRDEAVRRLNQSRVELARAEERVRQDIRDALERLSLARERGAAYAELLGFERRKWEAERRDFDRGRSSTDTLIRFEGDVHRAETQLARARADEWAGWAALALATGRLLEALGAAEAAR